MSPAAPVIRNISDTALWAAAFRADETERSDAVFRDPLARRLAGERGAQAIDSMPSKDRHAWAWVTRTWLFDHFIQRCVQAGADAVINLAAGLDARPYRMDLPPHLKWIEVDLPELISYKEQVLRGERARCRLERVALDLADVDARRELFGRVGREFRSITVITEGLLVYLSPEEVAALAQDLAGPAGMRHWVLELASPGLLRMLQKRIGGQLGAAGAPLKFGPAEGPGFFEPHGWREVEARGMLKAAARLKRLSLMFRLMALLPASNGKQGNRPWSGVCLLERTAR